MGARTSHMGNGPVPDLPTDMNVLITGLLIVAAAVTAAPMTGFVIVSIASRRGDSKWSLGGPPKGVIEAAARRILNFHSDDRLPTSRTSRIRACELSVGAAPASPAESPQRTAEWRLAAEISARHLPDTAVPR
jgi:hypothetical protein